MDKKTLGMYYFSGDLLSFFPGEWITGATCMYIIDYLLKSYGVKEDVTNILDNIELVAVPFVNPDGYVVSGSNFKIHLTACYSSQSLPSSCHSSYITVSKASLACIHLSQWPFVYHAFSSSVLVYWCTPAFSSSSLGWL